MDKRNKFLINAIVIWILVVILMILPIKESIDNYQHGMETALHGGNIIYGMEAFLFTLSLYICFYFPVFLLWLVLFIEAIVVTITTIVKYKKHSRNSNMIEKNK